MARQDRQVQGRGLQQRPRDRRHGRDRDGDRWDAERREEGDGGERLRAEQPGQAGQGGQAGQAGKAGQTGEAGQGGQAGQAGQGGQAGNAWEGRQGWQARQEAPAEREQGRKGWIALVTFMADLLSARGATPVFPVCPQGEL